MLKTLSARLIFSYVAVVLLALLLAGAGLVVLGIQYKREEAYARMTSNLFFILPQLRGPGERPGGIRDDFRTELEPQLEAANLRLLLLGPTGRVLFDSMSGAGIPAVDAVDLSTARQTTERQLLTGSVRDAAQDEWLYLAATPRDLLRPGFNPPAQGREPAFAYLALAQRAPTIFEVWEDLGGRLLPATAIGLAAALLLGLLLARSITRPLAHLTLATRRMAAGDYNQHVPLEGSQEFVALAEHFNHMAAEVERSRRMQHDFLANVSHDLKTPLTSIQGFSQAMLDGAVANPAGYAAAARVINDEALRMSRLVSDLLDLARIQSGEIKIERRLIDVAPLLRQAAVLMQPQATERHVELRVEVGQLPQVLADPDRLHRAVANLIDNALRHTPPEGRVIVRGDVAPGELLIAVRDTGEGVPPEDLPRIFERFYQVDKSRAAKGGSSGLGLAIVQEIVTGHGGRITVQSQPGVGTEFRIALPLAGSAPQAPQPNGAARSPESRHSTVRG